MDLQMLFGGLFIALCNGLDDEARARALGMLTHFADFTNFSPSERDAFYTTQDGRRCFFAGQRA